VRNFACSRDCSNGPSGDAHAATGHLLRQLRSAGIVAARPPAGAPSVERILGDYRSYLHKTCGLASSTVRDRLHYAREFMQSVFGSGRIGCRRVGPRHVQSLIAHYGENGRFAAAGKAAVSLRSLLRWLKSEGKISASLIGAVPHFRRWRMASLPTVMTDDQIRSFLAVFDRSRPSGRRDYAMALCMVDLN
jgi:integrase/recombinase XerD